MKKRVLQTAAAMAAAVLLMGSVRAEPSVSAKCAILLDAASGRVLYAKNADEPRLIASTTKIMSGLLVCENCDPEQEVTVPDAAVGVEGSSMYLQKGETLTIRELLYGMMLRSGNDAATALAILLDGSPEAFAARMNDRAAELGLGDIHFTNPSGLDQEEHYASARSLGKLAAAAMENELFRQVVSTKTVTIGDRVLTNHNKLLWQYAGAVGVKTGFTKAAGRTLVSCAERDGRRLIAVTLCDPDDWRDHTNLLDYGFSAYVQTAVLTAGQVLCRIPVLSGQAEAAAVCVQTDVSYPLLPGEQPEIRLKAPQFVFAPVLRGQAGTAEVWLNGQKIAETPIYYENSVPKDG